MCASVCKKEENAPFTAVGKKWEHVARAQHISVFQYSYISTSLAGALRTVEYMSFASRTPPLGDAVFPRLLVELAVFGTLHFGKYSTYEIAERIFTFTKLVLRSRAKKSMIKSPSAIP